MFSSSSPGIASLLLLCLLCCQLGITAVPPLGGLRGQWAWWKPSLESLFLHTSGAAFWDVVAETWLHVHPWAFVHPFVCVCVWLCATQPLLITAPGFGCWGPELPARSTAWGMGSGHLPGTSRGSTRLLALRELQVDVSKQ